MNTRRKKPLLEAHQRRPTMEPLPSSVSATVCTFPAFSKTCHFFKLLFFLNQGFGREKQKGGAECWRGSHGYDALGAPEKLMPLVRDRMMGAGVEAGGSWPWGGRERTPLPPAPPQAAGSLVCRGTKDAVCTCPSSAPA